MRQKWRDLLFLHWAVAPEAIRPLIPPQLELDLFEGTAYIGLVPFTMTGVRPVGLPPVWGLSSFHETNLRTYVRLGDRDPGVWFFNLEAASSVAVRVARALFHLPYHRARMFLERERRGIKKTRQSPQRSSTPACDFGPARCLLLTPSARHRAANPASPSPGRSTTSSSNDTSSMQPGMSNSSRAKFSTHPILSSQRRFTRLTKTSCSTGTSNDPTVRR